MDGFINVTKKDSLVRNKMNDMLDRFNRIPFKYQSKKGYDCLFHNVFHKELINIMGTTLTNLDIEFKMKTSGIKNSEINLL